MLWFTWYWFSFDASSSYLSLRSSIALPHANRCGAKSPPRGGPNPIMSADSTFQLTDQIYLANNWYDSGTRELHTLGGTWKKMVLESADNCHTTIMNNQLYHFSNRINIIIALPKQLCWTRDGKVTLYVIIIIRLYMSCLKLNSEQRVKLSCSWKQNL